MFSLLKSCHHLSINFIKILNPQADSRGGKKVKDLYANTTWICIHCSEILPSSGRQQGGEGKGPVRQ